jgi:hypothetical protein
MALKSNLEYWEHSLKHSEPIFEEYYVKDNLIVENKDLIEKVERLRELIISYCVVIEKNEETAHEILDEIYNIITSVENINYSEFVAFWNAMDISYSIYKEMDNKKEVLRELLSEYCKRRRKIYDKLGYSNIIVQALCDSKSSQKQRNSGGDKLENIVIDNLNDFKNKDCCYFLLDRKDKKLFEDFIEKYGLNYEFGKNSQNKVPDMVLKVNNDIFIIEAKHIKEGGGAQDKQMKEIIEFIKYEESNKNIHYISFMDGIYFNKFIKRKNYVNENNNTKKNKVQNQIKDIEKHLKNNKNNFFVNTEGFKLILKDLKG